MSEEQSESQEQQTIEVPQEYADARPEWLPEKFNSPEDLANSYTNLESKIGQKEEEIRNAVMEEIQAEAYSDRPAEVGDYILPDVIDDEAAQDNELLNWWADHAFENGFSQKEFEEGIMMFHDAIDDGYNVDNEMQELGDHAEERVSAVGSFVEMNFPEELRPAIDDLCATADGIKVVEFMMESLKENPVSGTGQPVAVLTDDKLKEMMQDPRYYSPNQRDPAFVKMVDEGFKKMYNR